MITIKPAPRSNPDGRDDRPWNIFRDHRCTNIGMTKAIAILKATKAAERLGVDLVLPEVAIVVDPDAAWDTPRPRGAPAIGTRVRVTAIDDTTQEGVVDHYLSTQFVLDTDQVVGVTENWENV